MPAHSGTPGGSVQLKTAPVLTSRTIETTSETTKSALPQAAERRLVKDPAHRPAVHVSHGLTRHDADAAVFIAREEKLALPQDFMREQRRRRLEIDDICGGRVRDASQPFRQDASSQESTFPVRRAVEDDCDVDVGGAASLFAVTGPRAEYVRGGNLGKTPEHIPEAFVKTLRHTRYCSIWWTPGVSVRRGAARPFWLKGNLPTKPSS